ncbi:MAG: hypothetical protein O6949_03300 [Chloroflexi bacterium]|nr:hypothetical protein [Chloroflexota bacterium]
MKPFAIAFGPLLMLVAAACAGPTPTPSPTPTATIPSATPSSTPTPSPGPCAGEWVGEWTQVHFQTVTGSIVLPTYTVGGKTLTLNDDCTYAEDWSDENSDIGCESSGLIEGEYKVNGSGLVFAPVDTVIEVGLDCGGGAQIAGSSATTPLHQIAPPGYMADLSALPGELILVASFVSNEAFDIIVTQVFQP